MHKNKFNKMKDEFKGDSNNTTATIKPKSNKSTKKNKDKKEDLGQQDIMTLINSFAAKIQRQWRVHLLRKRFK